MLTTTMIRITKLRIVTTSNKAILFRDHVGNEAWIPNSEIEYKLKQNSVPDEYIIEIPDWLAKRSGLDYEI